MKKLKLGLLCISLFVLINNGMAQDFEILAPSTEIIETVYDNRSIAMGKTAITTANSSAAIFSNPSILGTFSDERIQIGGKLLYGTITNEDRSESDSYESSYPPFPNRSYLAIVLPGKYRNQFKLVFGLGYQRNEGDRFESEDIRLIEQWSDQRSAIVTTRRTTTTTSWRRGELSTITPGIALDFNDDFFLGVTLNRTFGSILSTLESKSSDQHTKIEIEGEQSALFLKIGALTEVTPDLSIGVTYRPEFEWELGETITKIYVNGELETDRDQGIDELTIPGMWGIGAKYKVSSELVIAVELQSRPYADLQWSRDIEDQPIIDDGYNVSVGAEFLESGFPIRIGAFRDVIPFVDEDDTAPVDLVGLTAGIGSREGEEFSWDASVLWSRWEQTVNDDGQKYSEDLIRVGVSGTYHFKTF